MNYYLGIDLGTSGTKTVLFNEIGEKIASNTAEYSIECPENGWAEQNPDIWWNAVIDTVSAVVKNSGINNAEIKGIGLSGQMHGLVMLSKEGKVLTNCIIWCDGRTAEECREITETIGKQRLIEITANPALTGFTAGKLLWVRKHNPEAYKNCAKIMLPKDYIRYKLTGVFATEVSDASATNLFDVPHRCWSDEILEKLNIDPKIMPKVYESSDVTGYTTKEVCELTGLAVGTPVVGGAADNMAAAVGTGVVEKGKAFTTIGTSGVVFAHSDNVTIDKFGRVHTFCSAVPGKYAVMSCTLAAGLSLKWIRDTFCSDELREAEKTKKPVYYLMDREAEKSPIGANRLLFIPYLMGERSPILDEKARGVFFGLTAMHTKSDIIRSVLEGVIYSQKHCIDVFDEMGILPDMMYACGGGATSPLWRNIMADVYGNPVVTTENKEGPALGAMILAAVGTGFYKSVPEACAKIIKSKSVQKPNLGNTKRYKQFYDIYKTIYPSLKNQFAELSKL